MTEINPGMVCLVRGIGLPAWEGRSVAVIRYVGARYVEGVNGVNGIVRNAWLCDTRDGEFAINARYLVPLSDPTADIDNTEAFDDEIELVRRAAGLTR
jgi:hypothetical protein